MANSLLRLWLPLSKNGFIRSIDERLFISPYIYNLCSILLKNKSLEEFEATLRPILVPNENAADLSRFSAETNPFLGNWLRLDYLTKKYKNTDKYNKIEKFLEEQPNGIPSYQKTLDFFGLSKRNLAERDDIFQKIASKVPSEGSLKELSFCEILELGGCQTYGENEFNLFCEEKYIYEFLTKEYIDTLSSYLVSRALHYSGSLGTKNIKILEVGAGSGYLANCLVNHSPLKHHILDTSSTDSNKLSISYIATDSFSSKTAKNKQYFPVRCESYVNALSRHQPDIIICSWMPMGDDWTSIFRQFTTTKEYIMIGEAFDGCCGHNWYTWGNESEKPTSDQSEVPLYEKDGFHKQPLVFSDYQICRYDNQVLAGHTSTYTFKKQ